MDRFEYLKHLKKKDASEGLDQFTEQSLEGYQYLPDHTDPQDVLARLDKKIDQQAGIRPTAIRRKIPMVLSIAATLTLLVYLGVGSLNQPSTASGKDLFLAYHSPLPVALPQRGIERDVSAPAHSPSVLDQALLAYEKGNYQQANSLFAAQMEEAPLTARVQFYYGLSLLAAGETQACIALLDPLLNSLNSADYHENLRWYLALAHVAAADYQQARPLLISLQSSRFYQHKATNLLKSLKD